MSASRLSDIVDLKLLSGDIHPYLDVIINSKIDRRLKPNPVKFAPIPVEKVDSPKEGENQPEPQVDPNPIEKWPQWPGMDNEDFPVSSPRKYDDEFNMQEAVDQIKEGIPEELLKFEFSRSKWVKEMKKGPEFFVANNDSACLPRTWHKDKLAEDDLELHGLRERFLTGMDNEPRSGQRLELPELMFTKGYTPLDPVDLSQVEYEYLMPEIHQFEDRYGLTKEVIPVRKEILEDTQRQSSEDLRASKRSLKKEKKLSSIRSTVKQ